MRLKGLKDECFNDYKKIAMLLIFPYCSLKCDKENGTSICQNSSLMREPIIRMNDNEIIERYLSNPLTSAIVCGGLEPMDSSEELLAFCNKVRVTYNCKDPIVIYTGYTEEEIRWLKIYEDLMAIENLVIKYGRFIPNQESHYDEVLGVNLASPNQYAKEYNFNESKN